MPNFYFATLSNEVTWTIQCDRCALSHDIRCKLSARSASSSRGGNGNATELLEKLRADLDNAIATGRIGALCPHCMSFSRVSMQNHFPHGFRDWLLSAAISSNNEFASFCASFILGIGFIVFCTIAIPSWRPELVVTLAVLGVALSSIRYFRQKSSAEFCRNTIRDMSKVELKHFIVSLYRESNEDLQMKCLFGKKTEWELNNPGGHGQRVSKLLTC